MSEETQGQYLDGGGKCFEFLLETKSNDNRKGCAQFHKETNNHMPIPRSIRFTLLTLLAAAALFASSCAELKRPPIPLNITVKGIGHVTPVEIPQESVTTTPTASAQQPLSAPQWTSGTAEARAEIPLSQEASSYVEGSMLARRQAMDFVCQQLSDDIGKLKLASGQSVAEAAQANETLRKALEQAIRRAKLTKDAEQEGKYIVNAQVDLKDIGELLTSQGVQTANAPAAAQAAETPKVDETAFQKEAYNLALENARSQMREIIKQQYLNSGEKIGDRMAKDEYAAQLVETAINNAIISDIKFTEGRECQLAATLDPSKLIEILNNKDKKR